MARRIPLQAEPEDEPELDVASLIDVSFLLLIYFIVTSTLQKQETDLGLTLPSSVASGAPVDIEPVNIKIDGEGNIYWNKEQIEQGNDRALPRLLEELRDYKSINDSVGKTPIVVVAADNSAPQQRFVDVVNALAAVEINTVTLTGFRER